MKIIKEKKGLLFILSMAMILSGCGSNTDNENSVVTADISDKNSSTIVSHTDVNTTNDKK